MVGRLRFNKFSAAKPVTLAAVRRDFEKFGRLLDGAKTVSQELEQLADSLLCPDRNWSFCGSLVQDRKLLKVLLKDCDDLNSRPFVLGGRQAVAFHFQGMVDEARFEELIGSLQNIKDLTAQGLSTLVNSYLNNIKVRQVINVASAAEDALRGFAVVLIDGMACALAVDVIKYVKREVSESKREGVLRGSYAGFNETLDDNLVLIRRRAPDGALKVRQLQIGERTRTRVAVLYVENLVKRALVEEVLGRLRKVRLDKVLFSGEIEEFIVDSPWSPFPQTQATERPDKMVAALYEGRVAIMVDNTPWALLVPCNYNQLLQTTDDYTTQPAVASMVRLLRHISVFFAIYTPGIYVALTSYHIGILPNALALSIAELRAQSPFPAFLEALIMELILEIFQEATARLPDKIVVAASVVGGFVIGNTVVEAGLANPLIVVVMAMAAIASYTIPSYALNLSLRWLRVPVIIMASIYGLYGIAISMLFLLVHMIALNSFGESFLGPIFNVNAVQDWKDMLVRFPHDKLRVRPKVFGAEDRMRADEDGA